MPALGGPLNCVTPPRLRVIARRLAWLVPLTLLPLAGAWGLHSLKAYAAQRSTAALQLQKLGGDLNSTSAAMAWAAALRLPAQTVEPAVRADAARVNGDIAALRTGGVTDPGVVKAERTSATFLATLQGALPFVANPALDLRSPAAAAAIGTANAQYAAAGTSIAAASITLQDQSGTAEVYAEVGIWTIVLLGSALLVGVMWREEVRKRRGAVADAGRRVLAESERTYRLLFDRNPTPMFTFDPGTLRFLTVNRAATRKYGYSREEFMGMTLLEIRPEADRATFRTSEAQHRAHPAMTLGRHLLKDGRTIDVEVTADDSDVGGQRSTLVLARDVTEERSLQAELLQRAFHDALTGLANRELLADRFEHAQAVRARDARDLAVMVIDIDDFKRINDTLGHTVGDEVLRGVAARLRAVVRPQDTVARLGGDEFALLLDGANATVTTEVGERVLAMFRRPFDADGNAIHVTASAGVAAIETEEVTWTEALQHADIAMYDAKNSGKAALHVYEPGMRSNVIDRLELISDLHQAIERNELVLHYQPIVLTQNPSAVTDHVEALVRWAHPTRGLVPPDSFIPFAEQTGVIVPLGAWVLRTACEQARAWEELGRDVSVSVNVSGRQLLAPGFVASVVGVLANTPLAAGKLTLEITETAMLEDLEEATRVLQELRGLGVPIALDDFGAGFSSLRYLDRLPVDIVKIDRSFIASLDNPDKRATLLAITRLLDTMNVRTVAEGVETTTQLEYVESLGINTCQGFLFSRPVPAAEVLDAVRVHYQGRTAAPAAA
jgi:diguanylate cyclase (GGDEF)-like protein/PAS domain S-box-containing protein